MNGGSLTLPIEVQPETDYNRKIWNDLYPQVEAVLAQLTEETSVVVDHPRFGETGAGTVDAIILRRSRFNTLELVVSAEVGFPREHCCHIVSPGHIKEI